MVQDFGLAVSLQVECGTKPLFDQGIGTDLSPEFRSDSSILVRHYSFWGTILKLNILME